MYKSKNNERHAGNILDLPNTIEVLIDELQAVRVKDLITNSLSGSGRQRASRHLFTVLWGSCYCEIGLKIPKVIFGQLLLLILVFVGEEFSKSSAKCFA